MAVFQDRTGRRARALKLASGLGGVVTCGAVALFCASVLPRLEVDGARAALVQREEARLRAVIDPAPPVRGPEEPVLAAFVVNWDPRSAESLRAHAGQLTHVLPEWVRIVPDGTFTVDEDANVRAAAARLDVVPTVSNYGPRGFSASLARIVLSSETRRRAAARRLRELCEEHGWAGVNLDLEALGPAERAALGQFAQAVWDELHPRGFLVSVDVPASPAGFPAEQLAAATDFLVLMAYDEHASSDAPGPISSPRFVRGAADAWLARVPPQKLVVALGAYGLDWAPGQPGRAVSFAQSLELARDHDAAITWDAASQTSAFRYSGHAVHFLDAPAAYAQLSALQPLGLRGAAMWRLGAEDPSFFGLFAREPLPRAFEPHAARAALAAPLPHDAGRVELSGQGELLLARTAPQEGHRAIEDDGSGHLTRVTYDELPSGYRVERQGGPPGKLALSFDDGPDPVWTPRVLDALKERHVHAAFFVVGESAQAHPELVRRMLAEGHVVGNHAFTHPDLARVSPLRRELELNVNERLLEWITGRSPRLFRPPFHADGALDEPANAAVIAHATRLGYLTLGHDLDPGDYASTDPLAIARRVLDRAGAHASSVVLLHDGGGDRAATVAALPLIIDGLRARGLEVASPAEVIGLTREQLLPPAPEAPLVRGADTVVFGTVGGAGRALGTFFGAALALLLLRALVLGIAAPLQARRTRKVPVAAPLRPQEHPRLKTVSVVVPGYNEEAVVVRTVQSLLAQEPPVLEVICVDDGSTDRTLAVLQAAFDGHPRVRVVGKRNGGKASALNLGFSLARGEVVVALDADTVFAPDTVARLVEPFADAGVGAVAGNAKVGNRVNRLTRWQALEYVTAQNLEKRAWHLAGAVPVVPGAVGAWRRSAVLAAGGFHEDTLAEDTDLTLRLLSQGLRIVYAERAVALTEAPETAKALLKQRFRWTYGILQACWKHRARVFRPGGGTLGWLVLPAFAVYQFAIPAVAPLVDVALLVALARGQASATAALYAAFFAVDLLLCAAAVLLEGEDLRLLWGLPVQRVVYRQLLWVALVRALWHAAAGAAVGWGKLARTGSVTWEPTSQGAAAALPEVGC